MPQLSVELALLSSLTLPVGDAWLDISPEELERLLEERGGRGVSDSTRKTVRPENEEQEEESGYSLVAVTQGMKNFINAMSSHEGAEIPRFVIKQNSDLENLLMEGYLLFD